MAYMILKQQKNPSRPVELSPGEISLGRAIDNHVIISDTTVSQHHAKIFTYFYVSYIEDLNSTNGTFVNGKKVTKHILHPGDVVILGKHTFNVEDNRLLQPLSNTG